MKKIIELMILGMILLTLVSCTNLEKAPEEVGLLGEQYSYLRGRLWSEGKEISERPEMIEALNVKGIVKLEPDSLYRSYRFFDIQGYALDGSGESLRETIPYQRLMGHMDYYLFLEEIDGKAVQSIIIKMFDPDPTLIPMRFTGILKLSVPLDALISPIEETDTSVYLLDSNKIVVSLNDFKTITDLEEDPALLELLKKLSLMEEDEGKIELSHSILEGSYFYQLEDSFVLLSKI